MISMPPGISCWVVCVINIDDERFTQGNILPSSPGAFNKFPDFFSMGTFIDSTHMKF